MANIVRGSNMDNYREPIDMGPEPINLGKEPRPKTRGLGIFLGMLFCFALVATMFFSYQNRLDKSNFVFFSPSRFLQGISTSEVVVLEGKYPIQVESSGRYYYRAFIETNGSKIYSVNTLPMQHIHLREINGVYYVDQINRISMEFKFILGKNVYFSKNDLVAVPGSSAIATVELECLNVTESYTATLDDIPALDDVTAKWENIEDIFDVWPALQATAVYATDTVSFYSNMIQNLMPWNSVTKSNEVSVDIPWRDQQNNYIAPQ